MQQLKGHPLVDRVVKDSYHKAIEYTPSFTVPTIDNLLSSGGQTVPWGVNRVGGFTDGSGKTAWILDSGIDLDHPDLNVDFGRSASFVADESANDLNGHGSHVAGIVAAKNNTQDFVGVAADADVVAVKVCDQSGGCFVSDVKAGVEYASGNFGAGDVVNLSLRFPDFLSGLSAMENSITSAANSGLKFAIAAGNDSDNANNYSPARVENTNVWTVSAFDINDQFASFSNFGNPPIEFGAPGVDVPSLWKNGGTNTISGTSMSAPHMAALLLLLGENPITDGTVSGDPDGDPDPIASRKLVPTTLSGSVVNDHATLNWNTVPEADTYAIYRKQGGDQFPAFTKVAEVTGTQYTGRELFQGMQSNGWYSATLEYYVVAQSNGEFRSSGASNFEDFTYYYIPIFPGG